MIKWEYKVSILPELEPQEVPLNAWGEQGWELVCVVFREEQQANYAYLKRPIEEAQSYTEDLISRVTRLETRSFMDVLRS